MDTQDNIVVLIPSRFGSSRLPGKPLRKILGREMILRVCDRVKESGVGKFYVLTDDERIFDLVSENGFSVLMTSTGHENGTSRVIEATEILGLGDENIVVNVQGDEPLIPPENVKKVASLLARNSDADIASLCAKSNASTDNFNPNSVKVVLNKRNEALYFSRAPIPYDRNNWSDGMDITSAHFSSLKHIGIYAYRMAALRKINAMKECSLETTEHLEQLRFLYNGLTIQMEVLNESPPKGVDTEADLLAVEKILLN
jgi:3-deoxy-manno-octulosonate cytidylyltransferase (CMP-KDO synthetase)